MTKQEKEPAQRGETVTETEIEAAPSRRRSWSKRAAKIAAFLVVLLLVSVGVARVLFHGERLADQVAAQLNAEIRGEVRIGSIEWPMAGLVGGLVRGWIPITVHDLEVYDEFGDLVLKTDYATGELNAHNALSSRDLVLKNIVVPAGGYAKVKQVVEPYPESDFDKHTISLISAFYPKRPPAFRAGLGARKGRIFDLLDYDVRGVTMEFDFPEKFYAILYGISGQGGLRADGSDPIAKKLYYSLKPSAPLGVLQIGNDYEVLTDVEISRLALVPGSFPRDAFPRDLEFELTATGTGGAKIAVTGAMLDQGVDFFGGEYDIDVTIDQAELASQLIANRYLASPGSGEVEADSLAIKVSGPVAAPKLALTLKDVVWRQNRIGGPTNGFLSGPPLELTLANATASWDLATNSGALADTVVQGLGGEAKLTARFNTVPLYLDATIDIEEAVDLRPYLPREVAQITGTSLAGGFRAVYRDVRQGQSEDEVDDDQVPLEIRSIDLRLGRARMTGQAFRTLSGVTNADGLRVELDGTVAKNITGFVNPESRDVDLRMDIASSDLGRLLTRLGYPKAANSVDGFIRVGGTL